MLEKLNRVSYDPVACTVEKRLFTVDNARTERITLSAFNESLSQIAKPPCYAGVPHIYPGSSKDGRFQMAYIPSLRVHDFLVNVVDLFESPQPRNIYERACEISWHFINSCTQAVAFFQSDSIQILLRERLGPLLQCYDFETKFLEAFWYVSEHLNVAASNRVIDDVYSIADTLSRNASVTFLDRSPRNVLIKTDGRKDDWFASEHQDPSAHGGRAADHVYRDLVGVMDQIQGYHHGSHALFELVHIDFESSATLTTRFDDQIHVLNLDQLTQAAFRKKGICPSIEYPVDELYDHTLLFRHLREWSRMLFYFFERPWKFGSRYPRETITYNIKTALRGAERLRRNSTLPGYLDGINQWMLVSLEAVDRL